MNKYIRSFLGPQSLDSIIEPTTRKVDELNEFAQVSRASASDKQRQAELLLREAVALETDAAYAEEIISNIKGML